MVTFAGTLETSGGNATGVAVPEEVPMSSVARVDDGEMVVFGRGGAAIPVGPGFYRRGKQLVAAIAAHVSADLVYPAADLDPDRKG